MNKNEEMTSIRSTSRATFSHAVSYMRSSIRINRRHIEDDDCPASTSILTCSISTLSRVSIPRGVYTYPQKGKRKNGKRNAPTPSVTLFSFAAGSLDQRFFPVYIVYYSLARLISIVDKRTKEEM